MRLKNLINEENNRKETFILFITNIINDCRPYIKEIIKNSDSGHLPMLYSGRKRDTDWFEQSVINGRTPKDMNPEVHKDLDNEFLKQYGWRARSNVLFCSGDFMVTTEYGKEYMIFPKGQFKFLWNPKIADLFVHLRRFTRNVNTKYKKDNQLLQYFRDELTKEVGDKWEESEALERYHIFIKNLVNGYKSTNLVEALDSRHELMVNCKKYYAVQFKDWQRLTRIFLYTYGDKLPDREELGKFFDNEI